MTIVEALKEVLKDSGGLTHKEAYDRIVARDLYHFRAKKPDSVVNHEIRCHCEDLNFPSASVVKYFRIVGKKGNKPLYGLIEEDKEDQPRITKKKMPPVAEAELLPEEKIDLTYLFYKSSLKKDLLDHIMDCHPRFFEQLVIKLLLEMGYGSDELSGRVLGKSHDGGIDGVIYEDKLGLSKIYIQAKRNDTGNTIAAIICRCNAGCSERCIYYYIYIYKGSKDVCRSTAAEELKADRWRPVGRTNDQVWDWSGKGTDIHRI